MKTAKKIRPKRISFSALEKKLDKEFSDYVRRKDADERGRLVALLAGDWSSGVRWTAGTSSKGSIELPVGMNVTVARNAAGIIILWGAGKTITPDTSLKLTVKKPLKNSCNSNTKRKGTVVRKSKK